MELTDKQERFIDAFVSADGNVTQACKSIGIDRSTYYKWVNKSNTFRQKRDDAIEGLYDFVENKLLKQVKDDNITAIIFYCKTKMKGRGYVERQEHKHEGAVPVKDVESEYIEPGED